MSAATIAVIVVVVAVVVLAVSAMTTVHRWRLRRRFGPEYDRLVGEKRSQLRAAAELTRRGWRVQRLNIRPLTATARAEYAAEWRGVQEGFVDQPLHAVTEADELVVSVMKERGYPAADHDQIAADLSVTQAGALGHYRAARQISADAERGDASTEHLRQAFIHFRWVFGDLLGRPADEAQCVTDGGEPRPAEAVQRRAAIAAPARRAEPDQLPVPDGASREPDGAGHEPDGAGGPAPAEQLWRPAIRVSPERASEESETAR